MTEWPARTCSVAGHSHSCRHSSGNAWEGACLAVEIAFYSAAGALPLLQPVSLRGLKNSLRGIDQPAPGLTMEVGPQARSAGVSQAAMRACGTHGGWSVDRADGAEESGIGTPSRDLPGPCLRPNRLVGAAAPGPHASRAAGARCPWWEFPPAGRFSKSPRGLWGLLSVDSS
jgi:hypothetical protein